MANKKGRMLQPTSYNETTGGAGPESFDESGGGLYGSWDEVMSAHLSMDQADLAESPNMQSGKGIVGGPAKGEPNPAGFSTTAESAGGKK